MLRLFLLSVLVLFSHNLRLEVNGGNGMMTDEHTEKFPNSLQEFGYGFNSDGQLRKIDPVTQSLSSAGFEFNVSSNPTYNQKRYEALGEVITEYVYKMLETDCGLYKLPVPTNEPDSTFIFASPDALTTDHNLLVLIHGGGVVRAGQWARSLIINDSLQSGTQIPYIKRAMKLGHGVLVLNTNDNYRTVNGAAVPIKGSSNALQHAEWVWNNYIKKAKANKIAFVAHSLGGSCILALALKHFEEFSKRVFAIALTDSCHGPGLIEKNGKPMEYLRKISRNWVSSSLSLDEPVKQAHVYDITSVSAGHTKHEMTSWSCINSAFKFIENCFSLNQAPS